MTTVINERRRTKAYLAGFVATILTGSILYGAYLYNRPLPEVKAIVSAKQNADQPGESVPIAWPAYGQSAIGMTGRGLLASSGTNQKPVPTASVAKVMTALAVLQKKPLAVGEKGPMLTVTANDVAIFNNYLALDGSLVKVAEGEKISQYDALQALMLPSANNMADLLANWAFGSIEAYSQYANQYAKAHGMTHSTFSDASGFSPNTVSTADDLIQLGLLALKNPVLAEIIAKPTANIPLGDAVGPIYNVNGLLGKNGINGIKTGATDQAGGVFLTSADRQIGDENTTVLAVVMGGPSLETAMRATLPLLDTASGNLTRKTLAKAGTVYGSYTAPWSKQTVKAVASRDVSMLAWKGDNYTSRIELRPIRGQQSDGSNVGNVTIKASSQESIVPLELKGSVSKPDFRWRLKRD